MAISTYDYGAVDPATWMLPTMINNLENAISATAVPGAREAIAALDAFREQVYLEIERQGAR